MEPSPLGIWLRRLAAVLAVLAFAGVVIGVWAGAAAINADVLTPRRNVPTADLEVVEVETGRIVVTRSRLSEQDGIWGVEAPNAYGQVTGLVEVGEDTVAHGFRTIEGDFVPGEAVRWDPYAFNGDPATAAGLAFEDVRVPGELGVDPTWLVSGIRDTWVVMVHGEGLDERRQALRILPTLADLGYPILVTTYRNDGVAPEADPDRYGWGLTEWPDVDAAVSYALQRGATDVVLYGYGMGGSIVTTYLHESDRTDLVRGVILDSPALDVGVLADRAVAAHGVPGLFTGLAKEVVRIWNGLEWGALDEVARAGELDVPMLLMHGTADEVAPVEVSDAFAEARPDLVTYERFDGAIHDGLWNLDPTRYMSAVSDFMGRVAPDTEP
jgi:alpha-beta hydrolase superfamily lysophospholipase